MKVVWVLAVIAGAFIYFVKNYNEIKIYLSTINAINVGLSLALLVIFKLFTIDLVKNSLASIGWYPEFKKAFSFVSISQLGKFIPGGIWQYVARFSNYKENGINTKNSAKAFVYENIWLIFGSFLVSIFYLFISKPDILLDQFHISISFSWQTIIACIALALWVIVLFASELFYRANTEIFSVKKVVWNFISQTLMWTVYGISFFVLMNHAKSANDLVFTIGAFGLSFLAGYIAIFAPGGIGVREATALYLFTALFSNSAIGIYILVHRFIYTLVDLLFAGIAMIIIRR